MFLIVAKIDLISYFFFISWSLNNHIVQLFKIYCQRYMIIIILECNFKYSICLFHLGLGFFATVLFSLHPSESASSCSVFFHTQTHEHVVTTTHLNIAHNPHRTKQRSFGIHTLNRHRSLHKHQQKPTNTAFSLCVRIDPLEQASTVGFPRFQP